MGKKIDYSETESAQLTDSRDLAYLKANGARALPDSPTERGWSAAAIKRQLFMQPEILYAWLKKLAESQLALAQTIDSYLDALSKGKETPKVYPTLDDAEAAQASGALVSGSLVFVAGDDVEVYLVGSDGSLSDIGLPLKETKSRIEAAESKVSVLETRADEADSGISALEARADRAESGISSLEQASETHGEAIEAIEASSVSFNKRSLDGSVLADGLKTATEGSYSAIYARRSEQDAEGNPISATYATKKEVADSISSLEKRTFQVVDELPATGEEGVIYLMAVSSDPEDGYSQYIYENGAYIGLGTTKIDLSAYATIDLVNLKTKKFIFGPALLKDVIIAAYEEEEFRDALGFADATDVGEGGKATYGKCVILTEELTRNAEGSIIGAEYSVVANGELYHAVLLENGGSHTVAISNPYVRKDDAVLAKALESISGVQQGVVGQYLKQTPAVLVGSDYAINLKLRESRNLLKLPDIPETTTNGITYSITNGTIKISGTPTSGKTVELTIATLSTPIPAGDITLSYTQKNQSNIGAKENYFMMTLRSPSGNFVTNIGNDGSNFPAGARATSTRATKNEVGIVYFPCLDGYTYDQEISDIQIEKGSIAHPYDEYGTYSKGSVVQYAGKNVLNLPGTSEMGETSSIAGKANVPYVVVSYGSLGDRIQVSKDGSFVNGYSVSNAKMMAIRKGHRYFAWMKGEIASPSTMPPYFTFWLGPNGVSPELGYFKESDLGNGVHASIISPNANVDEVSLALVASHTLGRVSFTDGDVIEQMGAIDLTANGDGNLTVQEAYEKYAPYLDTLASGASIANNKRTSPLIKNFGTGLYLTKPEGYSLIISEFSDMPPALNESVDFDDLTFLAQTKYSSSGKVTLQPTTQSIIYMVEKDGGGVISDGDLTLWQSSSQLEYGDYATDITAYIAPKVLGTFDYLEGDAKSIITKVGEGDNVHVGFIPDKGYLGIDYANSTDDLSQSYVAYRTIDLATQVANNTDEIEEIKSGLGVKDGEVTSEKIADGAVALSKLASETKEYIEERARFLSLGDARFIKQSVVPKLRSYELSIAPSALKGKFGLGSYVPQGTEQCLIYYGDDPSPMTLATVSLGEDGNWVVKPSQTLASGTEVSCGDLLYKVTQGICKAGVFQTNIWDCVKPISCRFPLQPLFTNNSVVLRKIRECDIILKGSGTSRGGITLGDVKNANINLDTSEMNGVNEQNYMTFGFNGYGVNRTAFFDLIKSNKNGQTAVCNPTLAGYGEYTSDHNYCPSLNTWSDTVSINDSALSSDYTGIYSGVWLNYGSYDTSDHNWHMYKEGVLTKSLKLNWRFNVDNNGTVSFDVVPYFVEPTATASVMTMSIGDSPAEPVGISVPEGAVGIFSVDGDGNTINAMTGEVVG